MRPIISDWTWFGSDLTGWNYPPKIDGFVGFEDGLNETIPLKIGEIKKRLQAIDKWSKHEYAAVAKNTKPGSFEEWFWTFWVACGEAEAEIIEKWLKYWLALWREIHPEQKPRVLPGKLTEADFDRAREADWDRLLPNLRSFGRMRTSLCPFHSESTPSFFVYEDNHAYCFSCAWHGNPIDFIMQKENRTFIDAVRSLI